MKKLILSLFFLSLFLLQACNNDEDTTPTTITASAFTVSIDENVANGTSIGTLDVTTNQGTLSFAISSQSVAGAVAIDASTGELTVADASAFDFETNSSITGVVKATNSGVEEDVNFTINLNDVDAVLTNLATSAGDYGSASDGDWIEITEAEFNALESSLNNVSKVGMPEDLFTTTPNGAGANNFTLSFQGDDELTMPSGSYLFAFKYHNATSGSRSGDKVKQSSTSNSAGFTDLGTTLPSVSGQGIKYFVLKGGNSPTTATGHIAFYSTSNTRWISHTDNLVGRAGSGDNSTTNNTDVMYQFQGLSTTVKQW